MCFPFINWAVCAMHSRDDPGRIIGDKDLTGDERLVVAPYNARPKLGARSRRAGPPGIAEDAPPAAKKPIGEIGRRRADRRRDNVARGQARFENARRLKRRAVDRSPR